MSSMYPVSGAFSVFGTRFVSPALGFTLGRHPCYGWDWRCFHGAIRLELLAAVESLYSYVSLVLELQKRITHLPYSERTDRCCGHPAILDGCPTTVALGNYHHCSYICFATNT